jgi:hypothetical protein
MMAFLCAPQGRISIGILSYTNPNYGCDNRHIGYHISPPLIKLITGYVGKAGDKSIGRGHPLALNNYASGFRQGQDNKLDTLKQHTAGQEAQYGESRPLSESLYQIVRVGRGTITPLATSIRLYQCKDLNRNRSGNSLLRDPTASRLTLKLNLMRRQSFHTRAIVERLNQGSKGNISKLEVKTSQNLKLKRLESSIQNRIRILPLAITRLS